jgi:pilus assembly protein CpaC
MATACLLMMASLGAAAQNLALPVSGSGSAPRSDAATVSSPAIAGGAMMETRKVVSSAGPTKRAQSTPLLIEHGPGRKMAVGDVVTVELQGVARIAIGNGALVKATVVDDRQIVLLAEAAGETTMHVWLKNGRQLTYQLTVEALRSSRIFEDLKALLIDVPGITAKQVGDRVVIEGRYPDSETALRLKKLSANFPQVLNLVPERPADADPLLLERMVQIDLRVVEVKKRALDQLGIKWASSTNGPTIATSVLGYSNTPWRPAGFAGFPPVNTSNPAMTFLGLATQITSAINLLEQNGDAWTLAEPRLSCRSGGDASFLAGGEIPIPVSQGLGAVSVEYKQYGVRIEFKPLADGNGNIDSTLLIEVSEPDTRNGNGGYVAFTTNRTQTQLALKAGEPLVISGLLRQRAEIASDGVPGLSRIPIISNLFKSRENTTEQTELFVIATPHVTTPDSSLNRAALDEARIRAENTSRLARERLEPPAPADSRGEQ